MLPIALTHWNGGILVNWGGVVPIDKLNCTQCGHAAVYVTTPSPPFLSFYIVILLSNRPFPLFRGSPCCSQQEDMQFLVIAAQLVFTGPRCHTVAPFEPGWISSSRKASAVAASCAT